MFSFSIFSCTSNQATQNVTAPQESAYQANTRKAEEIRTILTDKFSTVFSENNPIHDLTIQANGNGITFSWDKDSDHKCLFEGLRCDFSEKDKIRNGDSEMFIRESREIDSYIQWNNKSNILDILRLANAVVSLKLSMNTNTLKDTQVNVPDRVKELHTMNRSLTEENATEQYDRIREIYTEFRTTFEEVQNKKINSQEEIRRATILDKN